MDRDTLSLVIAVFDALCWPICFWWMYRISARQDAMLKEVHEQGRRIERISRSEHDLIEELHPQVGQIKEKIGEVVEELQSS